MKFELDDYHRNISDREAVSKMFLNPLIPLRGAVEPGRLLDKFWTNYYLKQVDRKNI
jgi:hypothetical protein